MNPKITPWDRLAEAARRAPAPEGLEATAPYGFATRVAALGLAARREPVSIIDSFSLRISLRALGVACAMAVIAAGTSYHTLAKLFADNALPADSLSYSVPGDGAGVPSVGAPAAAAPAAVSAPAAAPAAGDDPVSELLDIVS